MDLDKIKRNIETLNNFLENYSHTNGEQELFEKIKQDLVKISPVFLQNKIKELDCTETHEDMDGYVTFSNSFDINKLKRFYEEKLFELSNSTDKEDLQKKKLLKAKNTGFDFYEDLGAMIVGDETSFPYRSSSYITKFFSESGFPELIHDGSTRRLWVAEQLENMELDNLLHTIKCLFKKKYFRNTREDEKTHLELAKSKLINLIEKSCEEDDLGDVDGIFNLNVNTELLFNNEVKTENAELNDYLNQARELFTGNNKKLAVEKIWDGYDCLKTYYDKNTKVSIEKIVNNLSLEIKSSKGVCKNPDELFFDKEMKELRALGNNYKIRHHEKDKIDIKDENTLEYLFFRMLNLINLVLIKMTGEK